MLLGMGTQEIFFGQNGENVRSAMFSVYRRPGFNCVVKQLRFWLFKVDCEFKDCDLPVLRIGHTCVIYTLRVLIIASSEKNRNSQSLNYAFETRPTVLCQFTVVISLIFCH